MQPNPHHSCEKAMQNDNPLIADIEETYESKTGICLDLATLAAAMLRSQGIPTRLVISYAGQNLHAWTQSRINDEIILYDPTAEIVNLSFDDYLPERYY